MTESHPPAAVLAVDGGNSKTDLALVSPAGKLIASTRAPGSSHQRVGIEGALAAIHEGLNSLRATANIPSGRPIAKVGVFCLAGVDLPVDQELLRSTLHEEGITEALELHNDTFAVLWTGARDGWGIGVAAGTGLNCVGIAPDGRQMRFPALGQISGDWVAGGRWLGVRALGQAVRSGDGRGPRTSLEEAVPAYYGLVDALAVAEAVYTRQIEERQLLSLAPTVFEQATAGDAVARDLLNQLADEVVNYVRATLKQLDIQEPGVPVVLGGGLFRSSDLQFLERVRSGILALALDPDVRFIGAPPVLGAAVRGLMELGTDEAAIQRITLSLSYDEIPLPDLRHQAAR